MHSRHPIHSVLNSKFVGAGAGILFLSLSVVLLSLGVLYPKTHAAPAAGYPPATSAHYFYDFPNGSMYVYDMDNNFALVYSATLPTLSGVRGVVASPTTGMLYLSYGGDGGSNGNGSLLKYDLVHNTIVWQQNYTFGVDQPGITPDGKILYLPDGAASSDGTWHIIDAVTGNAAGTISAGTSPHNTIVSLNGKHVYLGGLNHNFLEEADTTTNLVTQNIGPLQAGVRPFTINGTETYAFTTATNILGFQVSNIATGAVLYTVPVPGFTGSTSHGISLSPDETQLYLMDASNSYVHVFSLAGFPGVAPTDIKDIALNSMAGNESPCAYDCQREGWVLHSSDGKHVFVGDSGDIIDTATMTPLPRDTSSGTTIYSTLTNTRKFIEIDWSLLPSFTTSRFGLGYITTPPAGTPTPTPTNTPTPTATSTPTATPTPGATIAQDTFVRPNQALWGTASDGQVWGGDANTLSIFSIANNRGAVGGTGTTTRSAILGPQETNAEVYGTASLSSFTNSNFGDVLRYRDTNNWYKAAIVGSNLILQKRVGGSITQLASVPFTATAGVSYTIHFRIVGSTLTANAWASSGTEPSGWMITATDSSFSSGYCGMRFLTQNGNAVASAFKANTA